LDAQLPGGKICQAADLIDGFVAGTGRDQYFQGTV
jgi:hypothetical protein